MDKMTILKLLGNFLKQGVKNEQNPTDNYNNNAKNSSPLSFLENFINKNQNAKPESETAKKDSVRYNPAPLQQGMLSAMATHDEFLRRVEKNNQKSKNQLV